MQILTFWINNMWYPCITKFQILSNYCDLLYNTGTPSGAVLEGFLRFPETTQDFPSTMGAALFGYNVSRGIHSGLNSGVNWPLFQLLVKENAVKTFFFLVATKDLKIWDLRKNLCCSVTRNSTRTSHRTHPRQNRLLGNYSAKSLEPPLYTIHNYNK